MPSEDGAMKQIEFLIGARISNVALEMITVAVRENTPVQGYFNGILLTADCTTSVADIIGRV